MGYVYPRDFDSVLYVRAPYPGRMADKFESAIDTVKRPFQKASEKITTKLRRSGNNGVYSGTPAVATSIAYSKPAGKPQIVVIPPKRN